jgi:hypothetical protein
MLDWRMQEMKRVADEKQARAQALRAAQDAVRMAKLMKAKHEREALLAAQARHDSALSAVSKPNPLVCSAIYWNRSTRCE